MVIRLGLLFVSGEETFDEAAIVQQVQEGIGQTLPHLILHRQQRVSSDRYLIEEILRQWCDEEEIDLLLTVGGTFLAAGPSGAEIVPEATASVLERLVPSLPETMRAHALVDEPRAILDRGVAGIRGRTLIINLPGGAALSALFLDGVADLLPLLLAALHPPAATPVARSDQAQPAAIERGLNSDEFAAFLRNRRQSS